MMDADPLPVLLVIADSQDFYYQEYDHTRQSLEAAGLDVVVAATTTNPSNPHPNSGQPTGEIGTVTPDIALANVDPNDYSAIAFVGGWGSSMYQFSFEGTYFNDNYNGDPATKQIVNDLINEFHNDGKFVAAVCHAVTILAWSEDENGESLLNGVQVAIPYIGSPGANYQGVDYWDTQLSQYEQVVANGAITNLWSGMYGDPTTVEDDVVVSQGFITGENYDSAREFGRVLAEQVLAQYAASDPPPVDELPPVEDPPADPPVELPPVEDPPSDPPLDPPAEPSDELPPVEDPVNQAPVASDAVFGVDDNALSATVVDVLLASDADLEQSLSFAIVGGSGQGIFDIDPVTGAVIVSDSSALNFEANPVFDLVVEVTDNGTPALSTTAHVTIELRDVVEAPVPGVLRIGDDLVIQGTENDDIIYLWSGSQDGEVGVWMNGTMYGMFQLPPNGAVEVHAGDGNDQVYGTDLRTPARMLGEGGHDLLVGGSADDLLDGGDGIDRLVGGAGNDTILGGGSTDYAYGGEGNDLLVGGDGDDYLEGGLGNDLLLGGYGADYMKSGAGDDLLIAGRTSYDDQLPSLAALRDAWLSSDSFSARVQGLLSGSTGPRLAWGETVFDDGANDILCTGENADLVFSSPNDYLWSDEWDWLN